MSSTSNTNVEERNSINTLYEDDVSSVNSFSEAIVTPLTPVTLTQTSANNNYEYAIPPSPAPVPYTTINGALTEAQMFLSVVCYEAANTNTMKSEDLAQKMHELLFSTTTRMGFAEQLLKGKGHFINLYDKVPIESHGLNTSNGTRYKLRLKQILLGEDTTPVYLNDWFDQHKLCMSSIRSSSKITPKTFFYSRFKIAEKNHKLFCSKFSQLLNGKLEFVPDKDEESGRTYEDYWVTAMNETIRDVSKKDNYVCYPLVSASWAMYLFSPYSRFPNNRFACFSMAALKTSHKTNTGRKQTRTDEINDGNVERGHDDKSLRGLSNNEVLKRQKIMSQDRMINVHHHRVMCGRRNTYLVTLAQRVSSEMENMKNTYEMARAVESEPNRDHPVWKLYFDSVSELQNLREKQRVADEEESEFANAMSKPKSDKTEEADASSNPFVGIDVEQAPDHSSISGNSSYKNS